MSARDAHQNTQVRQHTCTSPHMRKQNIGIDTSGCGNFCCRNGAKNSAQPLTEKQQLGGRTHTTTAPSTATQKSNQTTNEPVVSTPLLQVRAVNGSEVGQKSRRDQLHAFGVPGEEKRYRPFVWTIRSYAKGSRAIVVFIGNNSNSNSNSNSNMTGGR